MSMYTSGRAWPWRVVLTIPVRGSLEDALMVIYHEAAHVKAPADAHHDARFWRILYDTLQRRWPFLTLGSYTARTPIWERGARITEQLSEHVKAGGEL